MVSVTLLSKSKYTSPVSVEIVFGSRCHGSQKGSAAPSFCSPGGALRALENAGSTAVERRDDAELVLIDESAAAGPSAVDRRDDAELVRMDKRAAAGSATAVERRDEAELVRMDERAAAGSACTGGAALHVDDGAAASTFE